MGTTLVRPDFKERLATYVIGGIFAFSGLFVALWVLTPEFSATGGILAGTILSALVSVLVALFGADVVLRAKAERDNGNGGSPTAPSVPPAVPTPDEEEER